ncbi:MAG TPA: FAD:protein FMN transferase [Planctomycetota bacterium]|nr:FAD:protein FMN transferase [Planctomycetota bacterium]
MRFSHPQAILRRWQFGWPVLLFGLLSVGCAETPAPTPATAPPAPVTPVTAAADETPAPVADEGLATAPYPTDSAHKNAPAPSLTFERPALHYTGWELGTNLNITIVTPDQKGASRAVDETVALIRKFNVATSSWMPGTDIAKINDAAGKKPVKVSALTLEQVDLALQASRETDGAFDPTWAAMWGLWNYSADHPKVPTDEELAAKLPLINYKDVVVDHEQSTVFLKREGMKLDLGGITKGSITAKIGALLKQKGFNEFLVQIGGELMAAGKNQRGELWRVGMQHPRNTNYFVAAPYLTDVNISTSGDYERFFMQDGKRYHHIIDPKTGRPSRGLIMVTVIGTDGALCDGYATALMIFGQAKTEAFVAKHPELKVVTIDRDGNIWCNDPALRKQYPEKIEAGE